MDDLYLCVGAGIIGLIPAVIAQSKGRNFFLWWIYGAALFIVALPHSLVLKPEDESDQIQNVNSKCPYCAKMIDEEALICPYCRKNIEDTLPLKYVCPECGAKLELYPKERISRKFFCPECETDFEITDNAETS